MVLTGSGTVSRLVSLASTFYARKVFLVTGSNSFDSLSRAYGLEARLASLNVTRFSTYGKVTTCDIIERGMREFLCARPDVVIAIGGGRVIDAAKLINCLASNMILPREYLRKPSVRLREGLPLIAVPTTAGSGSEATHFAVMFDGDTKHSVSNRHILPQAVILDPDLTASAPTYTKAVSGLDALSQAVESYWSIHSTARSQKLAKAALELLLPNLVPNTIGGTAASRLAMIRGANFSGRAIALTKTTAPHAISYPLTSRFGIAHGHAVSLLLPQILKYNSEVVDADVLDPRGSTYVRSTIMELVQLLGGRSVQEAMVRWGDFYVGLGLENRLGGLGIRTKGDFEVIVSDALENPRLANNPRELGRDALLEILKEIS